VQFIRSLRSPKKNVAHSPSAAHRRRKRSSRIFVVVFVRSRFVAYQTNIASSQKRAILFSLFLFCFKSNSLIQKKKKKPRESTSAYGDGECTSCFFLFVALFYLLYAVSTREY
jgi:hypothetical protein